MKDVSIIIVNYNTQKMTAECIESVKSLTNGISYEIILVDNNSQDGSREFFESYEGIRYIYNNSNEGFGRANNLGLAIAEGRNILFLNSDTILINNAVKILSDYIDRNIDVGACGGNLYYEDMKPNVSYFLSFPNLLSELDVLFLYKPSSWLGIHHETFNSGTTPKEVAYISGADLMVKKDILDTCGSFDPDFFMYFEETELCHRIKKVGYKIMSIPDAKIIHLTGRSYKVKRRTPSPMFLSSKFIYIKKTTRGFTKVCYLFIAYLTCTLYKIKNWFYR